MTFDTTDTDRHSLLLARILGETFRIQTHLKMPVAPSSEIVYGLLNGIEVAIDSILGDGIINRASIEAAEEILNDIWIDSKKMSDFEGFYEIEQKWESAGLNRGDAIRVLTFFACANRFREVIEKMNSQNSPTECRTFEPSDFER